MNDESRPQAAPESTAKKTEASLDPTTVNGLHDTLAALAALLRDEGIALANDGMDDWWKSCCDAAILHLALQGWPFTACDVRDLIPAPDRPNWVGARFHAARAAGIIRVEGFTLSRSPSRHSGVVRLWTGVAS